MSNKCKLFQNEEKRTSVVIYDNCKYDAYDYITRRLRCYSAKGILLPNKIIGKSICNPEDTWDSAIGAKEAYRKADRTHQRLMKAAIKYWMKRTINDMRNIDPEMFDELIKEEEK